MEVLGLGGPLEGMILDGSLGTPLLNQMNQGRVSIKHEAIIYIHIYIHIHIQLYIQLYTYYMCIYILYVYIHIMNV